MLMMKCIKRIFIDSFTIEYNKVNIYFVKCNYSILHNETFDNNWALHQTHVNNNFGPFYPKHCDFSLIKTIIFTTYLTCQ